MRAARRWPRSEQEWINLFVANEDYQQNVYAAELDSAVALGCRWLDLGAGARVHGGWQVAGARVASSRDLAARARLFVGADFVSEHLRANKDLHVRIIADGARLPFEGGTFDLVSANMVVEHLEHPAETLREVRRVLKPGGRFLFVTPNRGYPIVSLAALLASSGTRRFLASRVEARSLEHVFETHYRCNTAGAVRAVATEAGLRVAKLRLFNSFPFFRRPVIALLAEGTLIKVTGLPVLERFRSNLLVVLQRPEEGSA